VKYNWKEDGLIRRAPGGRRWLTTETLWLHVIARADDDEVVGARAQGQQVLDAPAKTGSSRVLADDTSIPSRRVQSTLTGDTADRQTVRSQHEPDWTVVNARKGMHGEDDGREDAARHPGQSRLSTFEDYDRSNWDVTTPWFRSSAVTVPAGQVY